LERQLWPNAKEVASLMQRWCTVMAMACMRQNLDGTNLLGTRRPME
jgi:hypothetical protein